jgi:hypothetical protein
MGGETSEEVRRTTAAERALEALAGEKVPPGTRAALVRRVAAALAAEAERERQRGSRLCRYRAELWRQTAGGRPTAPAPAREEARARANEASYLADLIESGEDPTEEGPPS